MVTFHSTLSEPLTPEEKAQARNQWLDLMFATSSHELHAARQSLCQAPPRIQSLIMTAFIEWTQDYKDIFPEATPFDESE